MRERKEEGEREGVCVEAEQEDLRFSWEALR